MPKLSEGNRLYLYRLLRDGLGVGRQVLIDNAVEQIESDGIDIAELGFSDTRELIEMLSDFVEVITFRRGNTYAVIHARPEWDEVLTKLQQEPATTPKPAGRKSYRRGSSGLLKPERPELRRKKNRKLSKQATTDAIEKTGADEKDAPLGTSEQMLVEAVAPAEVPAQVETSEQVEEPSNPQNDAEVEELPAADDLLAQRTVDEGVYPVHVLDQIQAISEQDGPETPAAKIVVDAPQPDLPSSISAGVRISPEVLGILYRSAPLDVDLMTALDQDWHVALGASLTQGTHARITFPTRFLSQDGRSPMQLTLQRTRGIWRLAEIDGDDGTDPNVHPALGIEGLALDDAGAWADLNPLWEDGDANLVQATSADPSRALPLFAALGPWEELGEKIAGLAAPETWDFGGKQGSERPILRDYLFATFARAQDQGRVTVALDGSRACFDTGLLSAGPVYSMIFLEMVPRAGTPAWQVDRVVVGQQNLSAAAPERATFLTHIPEHLMSAQRLAAPDAKALLETQLDRLPSALTHRVLADTPAALGALQELEERELRGQARVRAYATVARAGGEKAIAALDAELRAALERALARTAGDFRLAAPAFDARSGRIAALLPLDFADGAGDSLALVVEEAGSSAKMGAQNTADQPGAVVPTDRTAGEAGALLATAVVELRRAYLCARVVSSELPSWLRAVL